MHLSVWNILCSVIHVSSIDEPKVEVVHVAILEMEIDFDTFCNACFDDDENSRGNIQITGTAAGSNGGDRAAVEYANQNLPTTSPIKLWLFYRWYQLQ